jgi:hypothetical protein
MGNTHLVLLKGPDPMVLETLSSNGPNVKGHWMVRWASRMKMVTSPLLANVDMPNNQPRILNITTTTCQTK